MTRAGALIGAGRQAEVFAWGEDRALKLYRLAMWQPDADAEAQYTRVVHAAGAPAPAVHETVWVEGRPGVVYERLHGRTMLSALVARPWRVNALARQMAVVHAQLHRCSGVGLPAQSDRVRALKRWIEACSDFAPGLQTMLVRAVSALPDGNRLCHGDLHPDNVLLTEDGPRVIDWRNSWCGHPLADVARTSIILRLADPPPGLVRRVFIALVRSLFDTLYRQHYFRAQSDYAPQELHAWELPLAAARLAEGNPAERAALLKLIEQRAKGG